MDIPSVKIKFSETDIESILKSIKKVLEDGKITQGDKVEEFEDKFASYIGTKFAIAVNSGTSSLEIILRYFGVKDREVIVPTNSFVASANSVIFSGGTPVLADIKADTLCLDLDDLKRKITAKTKAVMVVHLAGMPFPEIEDLVRLCHDYKLILIEDAAQAHGAMWGERKVGSRGAAASFSFYATKIITTGEGGMITTNDENLACFARSVRNHGIDKDRFVRLGYNWRLTEIQAILGIHQLLRIEEFIRKRNEIVSIYKNFLLGVKELTFINVPLSLRHSYYKFPVIFSDGINTVDFSKRIYQGYGISLTPLYYPPIHLQPYYITLGYKEGMLPVSERILKQELCLPVYPELTEEEIKNIASAIKETLKSDRKI